MFRISLDTLDICKRRIYIVIIFKLIKMMETTKNRIVMFTSAGLMGIFSFLFLDAITDLGVILRSIAYDHVVIETFNMLYMYIAATVLIMWWITGLLWALWQSMGIFKDYRKRVYN